VASFLELKGLDVLDSRVVWVCGVLHPFADGGIDGCVDDGLIEVDDEGEFAGCQEAF
jgi:hypothetical protein